MRLRKALNITKYGIFIGEGIYSWIVLASAPKIQNTSVEEQRIYTIHPELITYHFALPKDGTSWFSRFVFGYPNRPDNSSNSVSTPTKYWT